MNHISKELFFTWVVLLLFPTLSFSADSLFSTPKIPLNVFIEIPVLQIKATSVLKHQDSAGVLIQYSENNLLDTSTNAWVEGVPGQGEGERVSFVLSEPSIPKVLGIVNGYAKSAKTWRENSRPQTLTLLCDTVEMATLHLKDNWRWQYFYLPWVDSPDNKSCHQFTIVIKDVYPGAKYQDAALTSVKWFENVIEKKGGVKNDEIYLKKGFFQNGTLISGMVFIACLAGVAFFLLLKWKRTPEKEIQETEKKQARLRVLALLQQLTDSIVTRYKEALLQYCVAANIPREKSEHIFTVLKFAQQHPTLQDVCNYEILHEIRQYRNRLAHPNPEYYHESLETLLHYQNALTKELARLEAFFKEGR